MDAKAYSTSSTAAGGADRRAKTQCHLVRNGLELPIQFLSVEALLAIVTVLKPKCTTHLEYEIINLQLSFGLQHYCL